MSIQPATIQPANTTRPAAPPRASAFYTLALLACLLMGIVGSARVAGSGTASDYLDALLELLPLVGGSVGVAALVAVVSSRLGKRPRIPGAATAGLAFALTLPLQTAALPATIAMAFGWIIAREVFGSNERSFVHPAIMAHVFLTLTWPQALGTTSMWLPSAGQATVGWSDLLALRPPGGAIGSTSALACLMGAALLLALGRIPWRILASVPLGMAAGLGLLGRTKLLGPDLPLPSHLLLGSVLFGVLFLATDRDSSPSSKSARWAHGMVIGFLIILLRLANPASPDGTMSAILVASVFAPLFDYAAAAGRSKWPRWGHV